MGIDEDMGVFVWKAAFSLAVCPFLADEIATDPLVCKMAASRANKPLYE